MKSKKDLIEKVVEQIKLDVDYQEYEAIEELLGFVPVENLIAYLPDEYHKKFKHLVAEEYIKKEKDETN